MLMFYLLITTNGLIVYGSFMNRPGRDKQKTAELGFAASRQSMQ